VGTPRLGENVPQRGNFLSRALGRAGLALLGWRFAGAAPNLRRMVLVVAPHTSNWDFLVGIFAMLALGLDARWLGKDTLFKTPWGFLLLWLGGIPVDRGAPDGVVPGAVDLIQRSDRLCLALSPEGTRRRVERWKTGFHRIARAARVPVWPVAFDYSRRIVDLMAPVDLTDDVEADVAALRARYSKEMARYPGNF
jgi:1-acyl-sn-glycerol-3-phosphate acyltransferase